MSAEKPKKWRDVPTDGLDIDGYNYVMLNRNIEAAQEFDKRYATPEGVQELKAQLDERNAEYAKWVEENPDMQVYVELRTSWGSRSAERRLQMSQPEIREETLKALGKLGIGRRFEPLIVGLDLGEEGNIKQLKEWSGVLRGISAVAAKISELRRGAWIRITQSSIEQDLKLAEDKLSRKKRF